MNRRQFFRSFMAVPIAATLAVDPLARTIFLPPRSGWPVGLRFKASERYSVGFTDPRGIFGSALIKPEGVSILYDGGGNRLIPPAEFNRILRQSLNDVFHKAYTEGVLDEDGNLIKFPGEWQEVFA